jgi:hypothetical protein
MSISTILIIVLILALIGALPLGGAYNANWGYAPGGIIGLVLLVVIVLALLGRL